MRNIINEKLAISEDSPIRVRHYDYERFSYPWHFHSQYEIIYFSKGRGTRFVGNSVQRFAPGDIVLIGPELPHYMKSDELGKGAENTRYQGTIVQFEKNFMYHAITHYPQFTRIRKLLEDASKGIYFPIENNAAIRKLMYRLPSRKGIEQFIELLQILKLMAESQSRQFIASVDSENSPVFDYSRIDKILVYLNKHYNRDISLAEIASIAAMNPSAFCRFFKQKTGKSFKAYVADMRVSYACKLILHESMSIAQVSSECGFETISYFNKTFKKHTGHTPTEYKSWMLNS